MSRIQAPNRSMTIAGKPMTSQDVKLIPVSASLYILQFQTFPSSFDITWQFLHLHTSRPLMRCPDWALYKWSEWMTVEVSRQSATRNCEWRTWGPSWWLERDSNPRPFGRKATNLPTSHHAQPFLCVTIASGSLPTSFSSLLKAFFYSRGSRPRSIPKG